MVTLARHRSRIASPRLQVKPCFGDSQVGWDRTTYALRPNALPEVVRAIFFLRCVLLRLGRGRSHAENVGPLL
jgi:hypothetical protein